MFMIANLLFEVMTEPRNHPDLTIFLNRSDEVIIGAERNESCADQKVLEYYTTRLRVIDRAISRVITAYSFEGSCGTKV